MKKKLKKRNVSQDNAAGSDMAIKPEGANPIEEWEPKKSDSLLT